MPFSVTNHFQQNKNSQQALWDSISKPKERLRYVYEPSTSITAQQVPLLQDQIECLTDFVNFVTGIDLKGLHIQESPETTQQQYDALKECFTPAITKTISTQEALVNLCNALEDALEHALIEKAKIAHIKDLLKGMDVSGINPKEVLHMPDTGQDLSNILSYISDAFEFINQNEDVQKRIENHPDLYAKYTAASEWVTLLFEEIEKSDALATASSVAPLPTNTSLQASEELTPNSTDIGIATPSASSSATLVPTMPSLTESPDSIESMYESAAPVLPPENPTEDLVLLDDKSFFSQINDAFQTTKPYLYPIAKGFGARFTHQYVERIFSEAGLSKPYARLATEGLVAAGIGTLSGADAALGYTCISGGIHMLSWLSRTQLGYYGELATSLLAASASLCVQGPYSFAGSIGGALIAEAAVKQVPTPYGMYKNIGNWVSSIRPLENNVAHAQVR